MGLTLIGDFADPLSFLASQRVERITAPGLLEIRWLAVQADRTRPMGGWPLDQPTADRLARLRLPGELIAAAGAPVPNSAAATAAYAESVSDGVSDVMRRALFGALWVDRRRVDNPEVIRSIVFTVLNPGARKPADVEARVWANQAIVPLGDPNPIATSRRLGLTVSLAGGPLTTTGQRRIDAWRALWRELGGAPLPLLLPDPDTRLTGEAAITWLADQLPGDTPALTPDQTAPGPGSLTARPNPT